MFTGCLRPCLPAPATPGCSCSCSYPCLHPLLFSRILVCCCCLFVNHFRRFPADLCKTVAFFNCIYTRPASFATSSDPASVLQDSGVLFPFACLCCTIFTHLCNFCHRNAQHICPVCSIWRSSIFTGPACLSACLPATPTDRSRRPSSWHSTAFYCHRYRCESVCVCVC